MTKTDSTFISNLGLRRVKDSSNRKKIALLSDDFMNDLSGSVKRLEKALEYIKIKHNENILRERTSKNKWDFYNVYSRYKQLRDFQLSYNVDKEIASLIIDEANKIKNVILDDECSLCPEDAEKLKKIIEGSKKITGDAILKRVASDIDSLKYSIFITKELEIMIPEFSSLSGSAKNYKLKLEGLRSNPEFKTLPENYLILIAKVLAIAENNRNKANQKFITVEIWNDEFRNNPLICKILTEFKNSQKPQVTSQILKES